MPRGRQPVVKQPLQTYGLKFIEGYSQFQYDCAAFAKRIDVDHGAPRRIDLFKRISDRLMPGHFEWHEWTDLAIGTCCEHNVSAHPGCSGCVAGHTRLLNPITGEQPTIEWLVRNGIAPVVMTLDGPRQAEVPYVKGVDQLYEVTLDNGTKFEATGEHRVLISPENANRWCHVSDLQIGQRLPSYEQVLPASISASCLSGQRRDVLCSPKTVEGYQDGYRSSRRFCGEQLPEAQAACQSPPPSPICAQEPCFFSRSDVLENRRKRIRDSFLDARPSMPGFCLHRSFWDIPEQRRSHQGIAAHGYPLCQQPDQSQQASIVGQRPFSKPVQDFSGIGKGEGSCVMSCSYNYKIAQVRIVSITKTRIETFYDISVPGPKHYFAEGTIHHNSAKTFNVTGFAVNWWLADPGISSVMLISTTKAALRQRAWSEVTKCHTAIPGPRIGHFIDSRMMWQARKGDDKHAIFGKAVEEGPLHKVTDNIKGVHTRRQMVVIDEATAVPAAIYQALGNMFSYPEEFIVVFIGNPLNRYDQFGRVCEPADGWASVSVETDSWDGKPLDELGGKRAHVVRYDAEKSPNILQGRIVSKHLPTKEIVEKAKDKSGGGNTPLYWQNQRGFWPPEGLTKTVFTQSIIDKHDAMGKFVFTGRNFRIIGMCDPAFGGGDRPVLQFAKMGEIEVGFEYAIGIEALPPIVIPLNAHLKNQPINYQLCDFIKNAADNILVNGVSYKCLPEDFGLDAGGQGGGLADIMEREWSPKIIRIDFGGAASEDAASLEDSRPACDVYERKNVEMQFRARDAVQANQMKGLNAMAAEELCNRNFLDLSTDGTSRKRIALQPKKDYKLVFKKSPDYGDAWVGLTEVARKRGFKLTAQGQTAVVATDFSKDVKASLKVYEETFTEEEVYEGVEQFT